MRVLLALDIFIPKIMLLLMKSIGKLFITLHLAKILMQVLLCHYYAFVLVLGLLVNGLRVLGMELNN